MLLMISSFVKSQNLKCTDFKVGTFKLDCTNYKFPTSIASRTEKLQKESTVGSKRELQGTIKWKSECMYELIYINDVPEINGKKVSIEIVNIEGNKAFCKSTIDGLPNIVVEFRMEKIN